MSEGKAEGAETLAKLEAFFTSVELGKVIEHFGKTHCSTFDGATQEQSHEQHTLFQQYVSLVEEALDKFLTKEKITREQVAELCASAKLSDDPYGSCVDFLLATSDYSAFLTLMENFKEVQDWDIEF